MMLFVSGAARSGKSDWAERAALALAQDGPRVYLATARVTDPDMQRRVLRHRENRKGRGFVTLERPCGLENAAPLIPREAVVLLECLPNWAANEMFREDGSVARPESVKENICDAVKILRDCCRGLVIVSDDIFSDGMTFDAATESYVRLLGELHVRLVSMADSAVECSSGQVRPAKSFNDFNLIFKK